MWNDYDIRPEIERARKTVGLTPEQFRPLGLTEWPAVEKRTTEAFCQLTSESRQPRWLWSQLKPDLPSAFFDLDGLSWTVIEDLFRSTDQVFLFASDGDKWWWYRGVGPAVGQVAIELGQNSTYLDEWGIADQHYRWLLCLTHHDDLVAAGPLMVQRLRKLADQLQRHIRIYPAIARPAR